MFAFLWKQKILTCLGVSLIFAGCGGVLGTKRDRRTGSIQDQDAAGCTPGSQAPGCSAPVIPTTSKSTNSAVVKDLLSLRGEALQVLKDHCAECHAGARQDGNFGYVTDLARMVSSGARFVEAGKPEESKIFQRMVATNPSLSMPPKGLLPQPLVDIVKLWIVAEGKENGNARASISLPSVFKMIREDFDRQQDRLNLRYIHFVNLWNAGMSPQEIQVYRMALSKTLNMLSTKSAIVKPLPIDGQELIYRVNLADYDLHLPHGLASPTQPLVRIGRWKEVFEYRRPARDSAAEDQYFSERYVVRPPEYLGDTSAPCVPKDPRLYHCDANLSWMQSVMTLNNPVEADGNPVLAAYVAAKGKRSDDKSHRLHRITFREVNDDVILADVDSVNDTGILKLGVTDDKGNEKTPDSDDIIKLAEAPVVKQNPNLPHDSQSNPLSFSHEHTPVPLMRGEWFISQVAANYKQRVYYHLAGIPDDTGVLDIALGIDDEGALVRDNEPDQTGKSLKPIIMRAGFTNSGVSKNHRILERIETQQFPNKALWRSYEFDPYDSSTKGRYNDVLNYPFGPILFPNDSGGLGYECVDMFSSPNELFKNLETLKPISDWASRYWTQTPINVEQYRPTRITSRATFKALSEGDQQIYQQYWGNQPGNDLSVPLNNVPRVPAGRATSDIKNCESNRESNKLFNFHGFEYQFMRPNGLQGFATVGTNAFISDLKVANDSAGLNFGIVTVNDPKMGTVVIQPLSCLSCHTRGLIPKDDQIREYVSRNAGSGGLFTQKHVDKASRIYVEKKDFSAKMSADNKIITDAIEATGATISDQEPIVIVYNKYARSPITLEIAAAAVGVTPTDLATVLVQARSSTDPEIQSMAQDLSGLANVGAGQFSSREKFEKYLPRLIRLVVTSGKIGY